MNPLRLLRRSSTATPHKLARVLVLSALLIGSATLTLAQGTTKPARIGTPASPVQPPPAGVPGPGTAVPAQPAPKPAAQPAPKPVAQPAPKPVAQPAPKPAAPAPKPIGQPAAPKPAAQPAPKPAAQPPAPKPATPAPAAQPAPRPGTAAQAAPKPASGTQPQPAAQPGSRTNPVVQDGTTLNAARGDGQSIALPLVSVGKQVGWRIDPDDYRINVPAGAAGRTSSIEVFSPEINRNDYATARDRVTYYGDELYGKTATLRSDFTLRDPKGLTLFQRSYTPGTKHSYETLYEGQLQPGYYPFQILSDGNGKNSYALRATSGFRVEASQFTVNARGQFNKDQLVAFVELGRSTLGKTVKLSNYDADGDKEIVLTLVAPNGKRFQLTASEDTKWATNAFVVTNELVGTWKILGRLLPTTRQFSNAFAFRLRIDDKPLFSYLPGFSATSKPIPPLRVEVVDTKGNPIPGSSYNVAGAGSSRIVTPNLPACWKPVSASIIEGQGTVNSSTRVTVTSASGRIRFVADCPRSTVQINAIALVCGQRTPIPGVNVSVAGQSVTTPATVTVNPGEIVVTPNLLAGATAEPVTVTVVQGQTVPVTVEYNVSSTLTLSPANLDMSVGDTTTVTATASTEFVNAIPATISVALPDGLEATGPVRISGAISSTQSLTLTVPVKAVKVLSNASIRASLEPNCGVVAVSTVSARTKDIDLLIAKTVNPTSTVLGGEATYVMLISNEGPNDATGVIVSDPLPAGVTFISGEVSNGGTVQFVNGVMTADIGDLRNQDDVTVTVRVRTNTVGTFTNTATVTGNEPETNLDNNKSSATIEVTQPLGVLNVTASSVVCGTNSPMPSVGFTINGTRYDTPTRIELPVGEYSIEPEVVPGASTQAVSVTISADSATDAEILYNVQTRLELTPTDLNMVSGETTNITATAITEFPYPVPATIRIVLPEQFSPSGEVSSSGSTSAENPLVFSVPVKALRPVTGAEIRASLEPNCDVTTTSLVTVKPAPLPAQRRESQVVMLARLSETPLNGTTLILSDRIPAEATYIAGSSRLVANPTFDVNTPTNAEATEISDPFISGDRLFWVVPAVADTSVYGITYRLAHTGALQMPEDRVAVIAAIPSRSAAGGTRGARIAADSPLGRIVGTGDLVVLQGNLDILNALEKAIPFGGSATAADTRPQGGPATTVRVRVENPTTDSIDNPTIVVEAYDADGLPANDEYATLESSVDILSPDATPTIPGFQVALQNGVGRVQIQNLSNSASQQDFNPTTEIRIEARISNVNGNISSSQGFRIGSNGLTAVNPAPLQPTTVPTTAVSRPVVGVGVLSIGGQIDLLGTGNFTAEGGLRFFLRGDILPGIAITLGINWQADFDPTRAVDQFRLSGTLIPDPNPFERFPLKGDSSQLGDDIRSDEGLFLRFDVGQSFAQFGRFNPAFSGVLSSYNANYNGVQALVRNDGFAVNGFITDAPTANTKFRKQADSTDTYFLPQGINRDTERVVIGTYRFPPEFVPSNTINSCELSNKIEVKRTALTRGIDYTIRYEVGILTLKTGVPSTDANGNINCIEVDFATGVVSRDLRAGVQARVGNDGFNFNATALQFKNGQFFNNSSGLFGVGVGFRSGGLEIGAEAALSGVFGAQGFGFSANAAFTGTGFQVRAALQNRDNGFIDPNSGTNAQGRNLTAGLVIGEGLAFEANLAHNLNFVDNSGSTGISAQVRNDFGGGFTAGLGLAYLNSFPVNRDQLWATANAKIPLGFANLGLLQQVPIIGDATTYGSTTISFEVPLSSSFSILLRDKLTYAWDGVKQQISFGVQGAFSNSELLRNLFGNEQIVPNAFGQTNVFATYDLDTVNGDAGRARVGIATSIPLSDTFSVQLGADANLSPTANEPRAGLTLGALYSDSSTKANVRAQYSFLPNGIKQVYTAGLIAQLGTQFVISPQVEYATDPSLWNNPAATFADGGTFSIAFAYRGNNWSILSNNTAKFGVFRAGATDLLEGEFQFGYQASEVLFARSAIAYRLPLQAGAFTIQLSGGFTNFISDTFAIGGQAAISYQAGSGLNGIFGVEGGLRVVDNLLFTVGYNFQLFGTGNAIGNTFRPGLYFRLDWKLDERTFGWR
jgi:uncharacterized repeat protein (TIGR01451 family)